MTLPPWLYQNTLGDAELQAVYVAEARKKVAALRQERRALAAELARVTAALESAEDFLAEAEAALGRYRGAGAAGRATVREQPPRARGGRRPLLTPPGDG